MGREKLLQFSRFGFGQPGAPKKFTESLGCCVVHSITSLWIKTSWGEKLLSFGLLVPFSSSEVRLELLFQGFAPAMNERFGGRKRTTDDFGDVLIAQVVATAKNDGGSLGFRKHSDGFIHLLLKFALEQRFGRLHCLGIFEL